MKKIEWTAGNGQIATFENITEYSNIADHTHSVRCDEIEVTLGGDLKIFQGLREEDGIIQCMGVKIRIPAEHIDDVTNLYREYKERKQKRDQTAEDSENYYIAQKSKVQNAINQ
jgi:hypothetical protein